MFSGLLAGMMGLSGGVAGGGGGGPIPADVARAYFDEASKLCARDAGGLWGIILDGPMIFVDPATRFAVTNSDAAQAGSGLALDPDANVWDVTLPSSLPVANTAVEWAGTRWTMVLWPLPDDPAARG